MASVGLTQRLLGLASRELGPVASVQLGAGSGQGLARPGFGPVSFMLKGGGVGDCGRRKVRTMCGICVTYVKGGRVGVSITRELRVYT